MALVLNLKKNEISRISERMSSDRICASRQNSTCVIDEAGRDDPRHERQTSKAYFCARQAKKKIRKIHGQRLEIKTILVQCFLTSCFMCAIKKF